MGARGPGARALRVAREQAAVAPKRRLPWKRKGLTRAQRVIAFLQFLPITKGSLRGKRMKLLPEQREFVERVFAVDRRGKRSVALAILSEPKGNGKTFLVAGICLAFLVGPESEERGEIYSASITQGKAGIIFNEMKAVILRVPELACRVNIQDFHKRITVLDGDGVGSTYEALSADARTAQGLSPTLWAYDELGEAPDGELLSVLMESAGKRNETLGIVLSTQADSDDHPLSKLIDDALTGVDKSVYLQLHMAPPDADAFSDETIKLANPAWGHFLDLEAIKKSRDRAKRMPSHDAAYRRFRLNQRIDSRTEDRLVQFRVWQDGNAAVDRAALKGRRCYGGLDLAAKHDLCALVLVFPSPGREPAYDILPFFWTPQDQLAARRPVEQNRFREWIKAGHLTAVPGPIVRPSFIADEIARISAEFDIGQIAYDKYRIKDVLADLADAGINLPMEGFGQGHSKVMAPAIEFFSECALSGRLRHGGHPVLTASVANAIVVSDRAGNPMIDKPKSTRRGPVRVDGAVALVMALGTARHFVEAPPKPSLDAFLENPVMVI